MSRTRDVFDPSGFSCIRCGLRFPWVASYNEGAHVHVCRDCHRKANGVRNARSRAAAAPRKSIASNPKIGGFRARGFVKAPR